MCRVPHFVIFQIILIFIQLAVGDSALVILPANWQRIQIPDMGTIDIPPTMEVQSGTIAEFSKEFGKQFNVENNSSPTGKIVIQQKGLNALDPEAKKVYIRIIVETQIGTPGEFEKINSPCTISQEDLGEISSTFRNQAKNMSGTFPNKILQWDNPTIDTINGIQAMKVNYIRQLKDNPPVKVTTYYFQNYDRMHTLSISYRLSEQDRWINDIPLILKNFRITPNTPPQNPMASIYGDYWVFNIIISIILTWGIGLAPPLIARFIIIRRVFSKIAAIIFVIIFWFVNITIFIALNSQSKTHSALFFVAIASYYILRIGWKKCPPPLPKPSTVED